MAILEKAYDTIDTTRKPSEAELAIYGCVPGAKSWDRANYDLDKAAELEGAIETGEPVFWSQGFDFSDSGDSVLFFNGGKPIGLIDVDYSSGCDVYVGPTELALRVNEEPLSLQDAYELAIAIASDGDLSRWVDV